nr:response regulator [Burkholderiaceae bacterium]
EPPAELRRIATATPINASGTELPSVQLPHQRSNESGISAYRMTLPDGLDLARGVGVFVTVSDVPIAVFVNDSPVFQNGDSDSSAILSTSWRATPSFRVAPSLLRTHRNELVLHVYDRTGARNVLGALLVGEPAVLERWAMREGLLRHLSPLLIGAALIGVGLIALGLWRGRRENFLFLLLAAGTMLWGAQNIMNQLPSPILPAPYRSVLIISLYVWFPMLLSVFFMRFAYVRRRWYETGATVFSVIAAPAMYLGWVLEHAGSVSIALRAAVLVWISIALAALLRYAWRERNAKGALLLAAGTVCVLFAVRDWVVSVFGGDDRAVLLTNYSGLALVVLGGWLLIDRYLQAYATSEAINVDLEARVKLANAELGKRLEQVQAAREEAEQASLAKSRFFAAASHDLRQPLHSLGLFAAALDQHVNTRDARDLVTRIGDSIAALESLFNELLDLSKLDAGIFSAHRRNVPLQELFDRVAQEFHAEAVTRELRMCFVPTRLAVHTDAMLLERILVNLVSNALRYTPQGGVVIGARPRGDTVALEIWDSGIGIAPEQQSRVYDEFYQVGNPSRDRQRGLGLGLAIVRRLTTLLGHPLTLTSAPGQGTRFQVTLPRAHGAVESLTTKREQISLEPFAGRRVLLADDDAAIRVATAELFGQWGIAVRTAASSAEVDAILATGFAPELALVDLRLEALDDGIDIIERVRARLGADFPALLISGDTGAAQLARVRASGIPLLTKPVSPARLKSALHAYLKA